MPTFATEFSDCKAWKSAAKYNISHTYWHYSSYCTTGFVSRAMSVDTAGALNVLCWNINPRAQSAGRHSETDLPLTARSEHVFLDGYEIHCIYFPPSS